MKKLLLLLFILPLFSFNPTTSDVDIFGRWTGEDKGDIGSLTFDKEGYAMFEFDGEVMGGREYIHSGLKAKMTYELNQETKPMEIDFIITFLESGESERLLGIIEMEGSDKLHLALGFGQTERPDTFTDDNSIYFSRDK
jgi:uncharacterized protein (TIGR03067 family)